MFTTGKDTIYSRQANRISRFDPGLKIINSHRQRGLLFRDANKSNIFSLKSFNLYT